MRLHEWVFATDSWHAQHGEPEGARTADSEVVEEVTENLGAYIMGRHSFRT